MSNRRSFIKQLTAAGMAASIPGVLKSQPVAEPLPLAGSLKSSVDKSPDKIWATLLHLSFNFAGGIKNWGGLRTKFEPDQSMWDDAIKRMASQGVNMVLINLDDSVLWQSHPEISLEDSWTTARLRKELEKIRSYGIEPIPLLNFAATHDAWLGKYSRMVSTTPYYNVCKDLIAEAIDLFDNPRFIHFGMDEEDYGHQKHFDYIVIRQNDLWWGDLYFYIGEALKRRVRPWVWSDYVWSDPDQFFKKMPKSVLQSNWYYGESFNVPEVRAAQAYIDLEAEGYDQVPTGGYYARPAQDFRAAHEKNIGNTVEFCSKHIADSRLLGFMQTLWMPTIERFRPEILKAIDLMGEAKKSL